MLLQYESSVSHQIAISTTLCDVDSVYPNVMLLQYESSVSPHRAIINLFQPHSTQCDVDPEWAPIADLPIFYIQNDGTHGFT